MPTLFESKWTEVADELQKGGASYEQLTTCKAMFYAGALALQVISIEVTNAMEKDELSKQAGFTILKSVGKEIRSTKIQM